MYEIKFRAWDKVTKQIAPVIQVRFPQFGARLQLVSTDGSRYIVERAETELSQFTGLKDKKGKQIYEGDIVRIDNFPGTYEVYYSAPAWVLRTGSSSSGNYLTYKDWRSRTEVIGNIYENEPA